jgi:hypothetical protein
VAKTTKGHESENLLLQQISEKQVNIPVDSCVNSAQINESSHPVRKHNSVTKHEAKQSHLHQVGLKKISNNSKCVNDVINNKGLSGKLNPDTVNNHPSTSQKITYRSVKGENRVTTPRPAPPEWLKCLPLIQLIDTPYNESSNISNNSKSVNDVTNNKGLSCKLNPDTVNNKQNYGHPSINQKITHRSVNGENMRVTTPRPAPPEWLKCLPLLDTPYKESSNNQASQGPNGRVLTSAKNLCLAYFYQTSCL